MLDQPATIKDVIGLIVAVPIGLFILVLVLSGLLHWLRGGDQGPGVE